MSADRVVAVIPARGGSKRIPRKNIRPFLGVPMIVRTIELLRASPAIARVVVSTDDAEILALAQQAGAEAPFIRDASLADDHTATVPVIRDAVQRLVDGGETAHTFVAVYPGAVFLQTADLESARQMLHETSDGSVDYVIPVTSFPYPIQRALRWRDDGRAEMFEPSHYASRSQDLEPAVHDAGQFYMGTRDAWLGECPFFTERTRLLRIPRHRVQDIDTDEDWARAELLFRAQELVG